MSDTLTLTINLSPEARDFIRKSIKSGLYASESDLISDSVESMKHDAEELQRWEHEHVIAAHDEFIANPSSAITLEELKVNLARARRERLAVS